MYMLTAYDDGDDGKYMNTFSLMDFSCTQNKETLFSQYNLFNSEILNIFCHY